MTCITGVILSKLRPRRTRDISTLYTVLPARNCANWVDLFHRDRMAAHRTQMMPLKYGFPKQC